MALTLQETAFADLYAVGWTKTEEIYTAVWGGVAKTLTPRKLKEIADGLRRRQDVQSRINLVREKIREAGGGTGKSKSGARFNANEVTKEAIIQGMLDDLDSTENSKDRAAIREKIAVLQGYKKDEAIGKEDPVRIYAPQRCEGCNLFIKAFDAGEIKMEEMDNI